MYLEIYFGFKETLGYFKGTIVLEAAIKKTFIYGCLILFITLFFGASYARAEASSIPKLQAAFIYQFTNYLVWPDLSKSSRFVISVLGKDENLVSELKKISAVKKVQDIPIEIERVDSPASLEKSHIIFLTPGSSVETLQKVIKRVKGTGTVIVSHGDGLAKKGAMINFYLESERLRFEINQNGLKAENIQVKSQLLNLARIVEGD